jgi:hypothetical protein
MMRGSKTEPALVIGSRAGHRAASAADLDELKVNRHITFEFAQDPTVTRNGGRVTISSASKDWCDATVPVESAKRKGSRHLLSSVPDKNAPTLCEKDSVGRTEVPTPWRAARHYAGPRAGLLRPDRPRPYPLRRLRAIRRAKPTRPEAGGSGMGPAEGGHEPALAGVALKVRQHERREVRHIDRAATSNGLSQIVRRLKGPPPDPSVPTKSVSQNRQTEVARSSSRPDHRLQPANRQKTAGRPVWAPSPWMEW